MATHGSCGIHALAVAEDLDPAVTTVTTPGGASSGPTCQRTRYRACQINGCGLPAEGFGAWGDDTYKAKTSIPELGVSLIILGGLRSPRDAETIAMYWSWVC